MQMRHAPFGVPDAELASELERRRRAYRRALTGRQAALAKLRADVAELTRYTELLEAEIAALETEERDLLRALTPDGQLTTAPPPAPQAGVKERLAYYRTLQTEISAGVLALIAPFLKEGKAWTSTRRSG